MVAQAQAEAERREQEQEELRWGRGALAGAQGLAAAAQASLERGGPGSLMLKEEDLQLELGERAGAAALSALAQQPELRSRLCDIMTGPPDVLPPLHEPVPQGQAQLPGQ